jgi:ribosomal protein S6E (S10)
LWKGAARHINYAPYLDYRPLAENEPTIDAILVRPECAWIGRDLENKALIYAVTTVAPEHLAEVRDRKLKLLDKTEAAVKDRLTKEINYWDFRAEQLKEQERAGKANARLNSGEARKRADELQGRLQKRMEDIKRERQLAPLPPVVLGGVLVVPIGLIRAIGGAPQVSAQTAVDTQAAAARAREIVMEIERGLGFAPVDREFEKLGYDIESAIPGTGRHDHRDQERNPLFAQQTGGFHPRDGGIRRRRLTSGSLPAPAFPARARFRRYQRQLWIRRAAWARRGTTVSSYFSDREGRTPSRIIETINRQTCVWLPCGVPGWRRHLRHRSAVTMGSRDCGDSAAGADARGRGRRLQRDVATTEG